MTSLFMDFFLMKSAKIENVVIESVVTEAFF